MRKPGCLRALLCALVLRARPCGGFALLRFVPVAHSATGPLRSHCFAHTFGVGALCSRVVWCLRFSCVRVGLLGVVGRSVSRRPFALTALWRCGLLVLTRRVWALLACARFCVPDGWRAAR